MTGAQVREARALLGWSLFRLEHLCGLPHTAIYRFEKTGRMQPSRASFSDQGDRLATLRAVFETAGIEFSDGEEPGAKLRKVET